MPTKKRSAEVVQKNRAATSHENTEQRQSGQLALDLDFYSETVKKMEVTISQKLPATEQQQEMIVRSIVREPMRLLLALTHLTVLERRLYWLVLSQIRNHQYRDPQHVNYYNSLTFYFSATDIIGNDTKWSVNYMKDVIKVLSTRGVDWETKDGTYTHLTVFPTAQYIKGKGLIMLQLHPLLIPGFLELGNNFAQFELNAALKLTSEYAQIMYSWLSRHAWRGKWILDLASFKEITGATSKSYDEFSNIRIRILEPAIKQICKSTDLEVSYRTRSIGKKVISLEFTIGFKKDRSLEASSEIQRTAQQKLKEALETVGAYTLEERLAFANDTLRDYYNYFTEYEKNLILTNSEYLHRFCIAECYISTGQVDRDKHEAYMKRSVFNPVNTIDSMNKSKKKK